MSALHLLYEDAFLCVVAKPAGVLSHPAGAVREGTVKDRVGGWVGLPHRLDRDTSGVLVLARTPRAHEVLARHFAERRVAKTYVALVSGGRTPIDEEIDAPIGRVADRHGVRDDGRPAQTSMTVVRAGDPAAVCLRPRTGRTHQLRVHCAWRGHPIVGDARYGSAHPGGLHLHAWRIGLFHPHGGGWREFTAPLPSWWPDDVDQGAWMACSTTPSPARTT